MEHMETWRFSECRSSIATDYSTRGYAVFDLPPNIACTPSAVLMLASALGLGVPFVPEVYSNASMQAFYDWSGINAVSVAAELGAHPAFNTRDAIEFHTDGTLQPL